MTDNEWREIYDTRRLSLWVRVPSLVIGGLLVFLAGAEIVHCVRDMRWAAGQIILPVPSKFIVAIVATGILAIFFLHLCVGQKRILLSLEQRALRIEDRWLGGWTTNTIAFDQIVRIETKGRRFHANPNWSVWAQGEGRKSWWLTQAHNHREAIALAERISQAVGCPVIDA